MLLYPPSSTPFPYTTLFRSGPGGRSDRGHCLGGRVEQPEPVRRGSVLDQDDARDRVCQRREVVWVCDRYLRPVRSEEHTSELQSRQYLVCRLLLEKKKYLRTCEPVHSSCNGARRTGTSAFNAASALNSNANITPFCA